jgi:hypothetical protein
MWKLSDLGLVCEVVRNSPTVGAALRALTRYQHRNSDDGLAFLIERGSVVDVGYAIVSWTLIVSAPATALSSSTGFTLSRYRPKYSPAGWNKVPAS